MATPLDTSYSTGVYEKQGGNEFVVDDANGGQLTFNGGLIKNVQKGTLSLDPASINTVTRGSVAGTITGAAVGDLVIMMPPSTLNDDLIFCGADITAADTVTVYLYNPTAGGIDDTAQTWNYVWIDVT